MDERLPRNLSPRAKRRLVRAAAGEQVRSLVQVAATADPDALARRVAALGGTTRSYSGETRLLTVDIPATGLGGLAELDGVVHVDADDRYRP